MCVKGRIKSSSKIVCPGKRMGDFAAPAAAANGSSICINNNLNSSLSGAGIGVNSTPHGPPAAAAAAGNNTANSGGIPKHSTVVERLRQRIEGCRRHHVNCESRYQQAQAEQLELERRDTVSLYQRTLEQRAKKTGTATGSKQQHQSKQQQDAEPATAEQRNHTLIMVRGCGSGGVAVRSRSFAGMSWRSPPVVFRRGTGLGATLAAGSLGERGAGVGGLPHGFATFTGRGGGSRQSYPPPAPSLSKGKSCPGGRGKERGRACAGGCRKPEEGFVCVCVSRRRFGAGGESLCWCLLNPAADRGGSWLCRLGRGRGERRRRQKEKLGRFLARAAAACRSSAPHASCIAS